MIHYKNVRVVFSEKTLFDNFNLSVKTGEKVVLFGASGTGKSTLLKLLLGFAVPENGSIFFDNNPVTSSESWRVRRRLSYIPQNPDIGEGLVEEVVESVLSLKAIDRQEDNHHQLNRYLETFDLDTDFVKKEYSALSGGEKQRIALIIGLMMGRKIFLLDEVTSSLDEKMKKKVVDLFADQNDWTVIAVSHDKVWHSRDEFRSVPIGGAT